MTSAIIISIISLIVAIVSATATFGLWIVARNQIRTQNLLQISAYLHQSEYSNARQLIRTSSAAELDEDELRKVCFSFDFAGLFAKAGLIDKKVFIQYWRPLLVFFAGHLTESLNKPAFGNYKKRDYYPNFVWLLEQAGSTKDCPPSTGKPGRQSTSSAVP